jgi:sugar phosphate isomerase/epimerase
LTITRRQFLAIAAGTALPLDAAFAYPLAFQIFSVRVAAAKDFPGTLRRVAGFGYREVELVSFHGYAAGDTRNGFGPLAPLEPGEIRRIIADAKLSVTASHFKLEELADDRPLAWASGIGLRHMIISDVPPAEDLDGWRRTFAGFIPIAERVRKAGMKLGFHTHADSWRSFGGVTVMDVLLQTLPAGLLDVQLDLSTTISRGVNAADFLDLHGDRVFSLHLRDGRKPEQPGAYVSSLTLGQGELNWKEVLAAARRAKVASYVVEMAMTPADDPLEALRASAAYLGQQ